MSSILGSWKVPFTLIVLTMMVWAAWARIESRSFAAAPSTDAGIQSTEAPDREPPPNLVPDFPQLG